MSIAFYFGSASSTPFKNLFFSWESPAFGRGGAAVPNSTIRRALSERSELRSHIIRCRGGVHPQGREWAEMVLVPFAETKGTRRRGRNPAYNNS